MCCSLKTVQEQAQITRSIKLTRSRRFNFLNFEQGAILMGEIMRDSTVWDFKMWPQAVLMVTALTGFFL